MEKTVRFAVFLTFLVSIVGCGTYTTTAVKMSIFRNIIQKRSFIRLDPDEYRGTFDWSLKDGAGEHRMQATGANSPPPSVVGDPEIHLWTGEVIKYLGRAIFFIFHDNGSLARVLFVDAYDPSTDSYISDVFELHNSQWRHIHLEDKVRKAVPLDIDLALLAPVDAVPVDFDEFNDPERTHTWMVWRGMVIPGPEPTAAIPLLHTTPSELLDTVVGLRVSDLVGSNLAAFSATFAHFRFEGFKKDAGGLTPDDICLHIRERMSILLGRMLATTYARQQAAY